MTQKDKLVLFLGSADRKGVTAKLSAAGTLYKRKMLDSSLDNWNSILEIFDIWDVTSVIIKLTGQTFDIFCEPENETRVIALLKKIINIPNLFLAHEFLLTGNPYVYDPLEKHQKYYKSLYTNDE